MPFLQRSSVKECDDFLFAQNAIELFILNENANALIDFPLNIAVDVYIC